MDKEEILIKEFHSITGITPKMQKIGNLNLGVDILDLDDQLHKDGYEEDNKTSMADYMRNKWGERVCTIINKLIHVEEL